ncbi:uncharacterized protein LOC143292875 isoform X2 [Babylonia areolata]|uniref:uncharacterized protein LOC143292875 isoform X2 n=1 Tax=Babylonia areolata TaxID=304850 RepID=UPI003FD1EF9F
MYWPSVQHEVSSTSPLAKGLVYVAPRLFGRSVLLEMKDLRLDSTSGSLMQPLCALLQPVTDKLSRHVQTAAAAFSQSTQTSAVFRRAAKVDGKHENSACTR